MNLGILKFLNISNVSNVIKGANKTLSFVKQAIPIYNNSKPLIKNIRSNFNKKQTGTIKTENYKSKRTIKNSPNVRNYDMNSLTFFQ